MRCTECESYQAQEFMPRLRPMMTARSGGMICQTLRESGSVGLDCAAGRRSSEYRRAPWSAHALHRSSGGTLCAGEQKRPTRGRDHNALGRCHSTKAAESLEPCHMEVKPRLRFAKRLAEIERRRLPDNCILIDDTSLLSVALPSILSQHQSGEWHCERGTDHRH